MRSEHTLNETFFRDLRWRLLRRALPLMGVAFEELRSRLVKGDPVVTRLTQSGFLLQIVSSLAAIVCLVVFYRADSVGLILGTGTIIGYIVQEHGTP